MITWAQAACKQHYYLNSSAFNYVVQDIKNYLVACGMTLVHEGYEWQPTGGDTGTTGNTSNGGKAFFILRPPQTMAYDKPYVVVEGVWIKGGGRGLAIGSCDSLPGSWPGSGAVSLPGFTCGTKLLWSNTSSSTDGYTDMGALCGDPGDGMAGIYVIFGNNQSTVICGTRFLAERAHGMLVLNSNNTKVVTWDIDGVGGFPFQSSTVVAVAPGSHILHATCDGETVTVNFSVTLNQTTTLQLTFSEYGLLDTNVYPEGTNYTLTGPEWPTGQAFTGAHLESVKVGAYVLTAARTGYRNLTVNITVTTTGTAGGTYTLQIAGGTLRVTTTPPGAHIEVQ